MLFECISLRWSPGIGDPTFAGWLTVGAYLAVSGLALGAARDVFSRGPTSMALRFFWIGLSFGLVALAINKQLDLQSLGTATGRCVAKMQGWYENRRGVQREFLLAITGVGAIAFAGALWIARRRLREYGVLFIGLFALGLFILMRASSFHHMDALINARIAGARVNWVLELGAIAIVALGIRIAHRSGLLGVSPLNPNRR